MFGSPLSAVSIWLHLLRFLMMFKLMRAVSMKLFSRSQPSDSELGSPCRSTFSREVWRNRTPVNTESYNKTRISNGIAQKYCLLHMVCCTGSDHLLSRGPYERSQVLHGRSTDNPTVKIYSAFSNARFFKCVAMVSTQSLM